MNISNKLILTDADGVLLDWEYGFHRWATKHHDLVFQMEGVYGLSKRYGIEKGHAKNLVEMFNHSSAIRTLPVFRDAKKYVKKLNEEFGFVFGVITSLSDDPDAGAERVANLNNIFGSDVFEFVECLKVGEDKDKALEPFRDSGCYWIEDKHINYKVGLDMGLTSILMGHEHNIDYDKRGYRVDNWKGVYDIIIGE